MKKFLLHTTIFSIPILAVVLAVFYIANGKTDAYYLRFTTPQQQNLILGTSGAAQDLQPEIINPIVFKNTQQHFFNYSFSFFDSPFGPAYFESIKRKLDPATKDGIFIIAVNPWSIAKKKNELDNPENFSENKRFIAKTKLVNLNPNIPYLVQSYSEPYINIIRKWKDSSDMVLHKDGWMEIDAPMDSASVLKHRNNKVKEYLQDYLPVYEFSGERYGSLRELITFLQNHGKVYLVRLPIHPVMFEIEDKVMPDFDDKIISLAAACKVPYLNFKKMDNHYQYVDGNHLYKASGKEVSDSVATWIAAKK